MHLNELKENKSLKREEEKRWINLALIYDR